MSSMCTLSRTLLASILKLHTVECFELELNRACQVLGSTLLIVFNELELELG